MLVCVRMRYDFKRLNLLRSLQWRLVTIFILLTFVLMISAGISLNYFVENFYYDTFKACIENGFEYWGIDNNASPKKKRSLSILPQIIRLTRCLYFQ